MSDFEHFSTKVFFQAGVPKTLLGFHGYMCCYQYALNILKALSKKKNILKALIVDMEL